MKKLYKNLSIIFAILASFVLVFIFVLPPILKSGIDLFEGEKYVLVVGDFSEGNSFGTHVLNGFKVAERTKGINESSFKWIQVSIDESLVENVTGAINEESRQLRVKLTKDLIREISSKNVVAIVSANTSQTVSACLEVGRTFNIPILLTVATSDKLVGQYNDVAFRMLANNGKQANKIAEWAESVAPIDTSSFGVLYSQTIYGQNLLKTLRDTLGFEKIIPFSISTTTDIVGSIKYGSSLGVDAWISLSYLSESIEVQVKKERIDTVHPILYADGAYGNWVKELNRRREKGVFLSFPATYEVDAQRIETVSGFGIFGYDSYWIIDKCITDPGTNEKNSFIQRIRDFDSSNYSDVLIQNYRFQNGENYLAEFKIYQLYETIP